VELEKVELFLDDDRLEPPLEEVAASLVPPVEALGIPSVQAVHPTRESPGGRFEEQVVVVSEQAVGVEPEGLLDDHGAQKVEKLFPIAVIDEDRSSLVSPTDDVVEGTRELEA
jgi:hypothetical protein